MQEVSKWGSARPKGFAALCIGAIRNKIARGRIKKSVRFVLKRLGDIYDVEIDGLRMRCRPGDNTSERAILERGFESIDTLGLITKDLRPGGVFFDIGANCGIFALYAAKKVGPAGKVVAIEPVAAMIERLRFNIEANGFTNVEVIEAAVGESSGSLILHVDSEHLGRSCATPMIGYEPVTVPVLTLKTIVEKTGVQQIDALKIDIEGYEDRALLPYVASMPKAMWPKRIMMEILLTDRWEKDCIGNLLKAGYRQSWRAKQDILLEL